MNLIMMILYRVSESYQNVSLFPIKLLENDLTTKVSTGSYRISSQLDLICNLIIDQQLINNNSQGLHHQ